MMYINFITYENNSIKKKEVQRKGNSTVVILTAKVVRNDSRELPLVEGLITSSGMSSCCPKDTFDMFKGKRIARSRAYKSLYQIVKRAYEAELNNIVHRLRISQNCIKKYERAILAQDKDIKRLIDGE